MTYDYRASTYAEVRAWAEAKHEQTGRGMALETTPRRRAAQLAVPESLFGEGPLDR